MNLSDALYSLRDGRDVLVIAHPPERAFELADALYDAAQSEQVACVVSDQCDKYARFNPDVPMIFVRPYCWPAETIPKFRTPVALFDSASFERQICLPPAYRRVETF